MLKRVNKENLLINIYLTLINIKGKKAILITHIPPQYIEQRENITKKKKLNKFNWIIKILLNS